MFPMYSHTDMANNYIDDWSTHSALNFFKFTVLPKICICC